MNLDKDLIRRFRNDVMFFNAANLIRHEVMKGELTTPEIIKGFTAGGLNFSDIADAYRVGMVLAENERGS